MSNSAFSPTVYNSFQQETTNYIINGDFSSWQDRTSINPLVHRDTMADCVLFGTSSGSAVFKMSRSTDIPDSSVPYSLELGIQTSEASMPSGSEKHIKFAVEGYDLVFLKNKTVTFSFWIKSNKTGTYCITFLNQARDRSYVAEYQITAANTWEEKTITLFIDTSSGTWNYENLQGLGIRFGLVAGSSFQTTPNSWNTGNFVGTTNQTNFADNTANYLRLTKVRLHIGTSLPFYKPRLFAENLSLCQRYFQVFDCTTAGVTLSLGYCPSANTCNFDFLLPQPMRAAPDIYFRGTINTDYTFGTYNGVQKIVTSVTSYARSKNLAKITGDLTGGFTLGEGMVLRLNTTSGKLVANAEIP